MREHSLYADGLKQMWSGNSNWEEVAWEMSDRSIASAIVSFYTTSEKIVAIVDVYGSRWIYISTKIRPGKPKPKRSSSTLSSLNPQAKPQFSIPDSLKFTKEKRVLSDSKMHALYLVPSTGYNKRAAGHG